MLEERKTEGATYYIINPTNLVNVNKLLDSLKDKKEVTIKELKKLLKEI